MKAPLGLGNGGIRIWRDLASADQRGSLGSPFVYMPYVKKCTRRAWCDVMEMVEVASPWSRAVRSHRGFLERVRLMAGAWRSVLNTAD